MGGIYKAMELGITPVKLNTVLIKGVNDDEIDALINLTKDSPLEVRFIELMPIGKFGEENSDKIVYNSDIIKAHPEFIFIGDNLRGAPASYYRIEGYKGKVGFISPMSHKFCSSCNRVRLTCDGKIKLCLGHNSEMDVASVLREKPEELDEFIKKTIYEKPKGHNFDKNFSSDRNMSMIGG
jgi:cyclic pyranopterin phosphate synthase